MDHKTKTKKTIARPSGKQTRPKPEGDIWDQTRENIQGGSSTQRPEFWVPQDGVNRVRLLNYEHEGQEHLVIRYDAHWYKTDEGSQRLLCLGGSPFPGREQCPLCAAFEEFPKDVWQGVFGGESGLKADVRYLMNVWVYALNKHKVGKLARSIIDGRKGGYPGLPEVVKEWMDDGGTDPLDPKRGRDVEIKRTGQKRDTVYRVSLVRKPSVFKHDVTPTDLFRFLTIPTQQEVEDVRDMLLKKYA